MFHIACMSQVFFSLSFGVLNAMSGFQIGVLEARLFATAKFKRGDFIVSTESSIFEKLNHSCTPNSKIGVFESELAVAWLT